MLPDEKTLQTDILQLPDEPLGARILIPAFRQATSVRGVFGWFSSGWIARLAPGLVYYLNRDVAEPIRFTVSPALFQNEVVAVKEALSLTDEQVNERVRDVFVSGTPTASALERHTLAVLAWMLATNKLVLRIAKPVPGNLYHPKMWLFSDGENSVLVRGSANATATGISSNSEHMDVDVSWDPTSDKRVRKGETIVDHFERGVSHSIEKVWDLPEAIANDIIETAPANAPTIEDYRMAVAVDGYPTWAREPPQTYVADGPPRLTIPEYLDWQQPPYDHQGEAVEAWENGDHPERGVLAMATGAGKTITALIAASRAQDRRYDQPMLLVVSAPTRILVDQWVDEVAKFGVAATAVVDDSLRTKLTSALRRVANGGTHVLIVSNVMASDPRFHTTVEQAAERHNATTMLVGDEAHTLGAQGFKSNQPHFFELRLGLSATPVRQYDDEGTAGIFEFFGEQVYEFGLDRAIGFCLVPYDYYVHAATLGHDELSDYIELSNRIAKLSHVEDQQETVKRLLIQRRAIIETAQSKIALLKRVLQRRGPHDLSHTLVYASSKNPEQFEQIRQVLRDLDIMYATVTQAETGTKGLDRNLEAFRDGQVQVLLAKKVLDEGFNVPEVREAFIVASSTIEREWVQRRGRALRTAQGKDFAIIHDFLVTPPARALRDYGVSAGKVVVAEMDRALAFARQARNASGPQGALSTIQTVRQALWPDGDERPTVLQDPGDMLVAAGVPRGEIR